MKLSYLWRGLPGHPIHPPLTDVTIGTYTFATSPPCRGDRHHRELRSLRLVDRTDLRPDRDRPTALTGLLDWLSITRGTELWKTATLHLTAMLSATVFFALAAIFGHASYRYANVSSGAFVLTLSASGSSRSAAGWAARSSSCTACACSSSRMSLRDGRSRPSRTPKRNKPRAASRRRRRAREPSPEQASAGRRSPPRQARRS